MPSAAPFTPRRFAGPLALSLAAGLLGGCLQFARAPRSGANPKDYVNLASERIYVEDRGNGPAILMIHGYCGSHTHWAELQPRLVAAGYRTLAIDLPGSGRSDRLPGDYSPDGLATKLLALLDKKGIGRAHVVAHSWGTSIALALALRAPGRVQTLSLIGVWAYDDQLPSFLRWSRAPLVGELLYTLFFDQRLDDRMAITLYDVDSPYAQPKLIDTARAMLKSPGFKAAALASARAMRFSAQQPRYKTLPHRVLLLHGEADLVSRLPWAKRLDGELQDSRLVVIPRAAHMPNVEQPRKVLRALLPFLAGYEPNQAVPTRAHNAAETVKR